MKFITYIIPVEPNNYGIAIQYILDILGEHAPRAVFLSATPITGAAAEIVDLLNLLVPRSELPDMQPLKRSSLFTKTQSSFDEDFDSFVISILKPGALEAISKLASGKVSYLLDSDVEFLPAKNIRRRIYSWCTLFEVNVMSYVKSS